MNALEIARQKKEADKKAAIEQKRVAESNEKYHEAQRLELVKVAEELLQCFDNQNGIVKNGLTLNKAFHTGQLQEIVAVKIDWIHKESEYDKDYGSYVNCGGYYSLNWHVYNRSNCTSTSGSYRAGTVKTLNELHESFGKSMVQYI